MKKILVCGDRNWNNVDAIKRELSKFSGDITIIHGDNGVVDKNTGRVIKGADKLAGQVAKELGFKVEVYPAKWDQLGRAAGPVRNMQMIREGKPDLALAFHVDLSRSKGTANMVSISRKNGVKVIHFSS